MEMGGKFFGSYYDVLRVGHDPSADEIRRAYPRLAMKWHPDRWTKKPSMFREAKRNFQMIREAYEVLSDEWKRIMYDAGLYDPNEGFSVHIREAELQLGGPPRYANGDGAGFDIPPSTLDYSMQMDSNFIAGRGGGMSRHPQISSAGFHETTKC